MNIMLISPNFFDYPRIISDELIKMGHTVDWFDDRPSSNSVIKAIIRINKKYINILINQYFNKIIFKIQDKKYDKVLVISGQSFSFNESMMLKLKKSQKQAEFILYQWDSFRNFPYIKKLLKFFDRCYSFDPEDVRKNKEVKFLPLFYSDKYKEIGALTNTKYEYDISFIGTAHPKKYTLINEMSQNLKSIYKNQFIYFYLPSRLVFVYRKIKNIEYKKAKYTEFNYKPLQGEDIMDIIEKSLCILDSPQEGQIGLTIRVIEMLGAKKKIITTNRDIINYDFYKKENIYVYGGDGFNFEDIFFYSKYKDIEPNIYERYSLNNWLNTLISSMECN